MTDEDTRADKLLHAELRDAHIAKDVAEITRLHKLLYFDRGLLIPYRRTEVVRNGGPNGEGC